MKRMTNQPITLSSEVPDVRVRLGNDGEVDESKDFVLYWMTAYRRTRWNFSLQRAVDWARALKRPLVVLEALRVGYPWASDRLHHFVIQGMADKPQYIVCDQISGTQVTASCQVQRGAPAP